MSRAGVPRAEAAPFCAKKDDCGAARARHPCRVPRLELLLTLPMHVGPPSLASATRQAQHPQRHAPAVLRGVVLGHLLSCQDNGGSFGGQHSLNLNNVSLDIDHASLDIDHASRRRRRRQRLGWCGRRRSSCTRLPQGSRVCIE